MLAALLSAAALHLHPDHAPFRIPFGGKGAAAPQAKPPGGLGVSPEFLSAEKAVKRQIHPVISRIAPRTAIPVRPTSTAVYTNTKTVRITFHLLEKEGLFQRRGKASGPRKMNRAQRTDQTLWYHLEFEMVRLL